MSDTYNPYASQGGWDGPDGIAVHKLRRMVAKSAAFQERSGLTESELFDRGRIETNDNFEASPRPFYVVVFPAADDRNVAGGGMNFFLPGGHLGLFLECDADNEQVTDNDQRLEVIDFFSRVRQEINALAAGDDTGQESGFVDINSAGSDGIQESPVATQPSTGRFFATLIRYGWGCQ